MRKRSTFKNKKSRNSYFKRCIKKNNMDMNIRLYESFKAYEKYFNIATKRGAL